MQLRPDNNGSEYAYNGWMYSHIAHKTVYIQEEFDVAHYNRCDWTYRSTIREQSNKQRHEPSLIETS